MEDSVELYLRNPGEVSTLSLVCMCVCCCCVVVFTFVLQLHIFYRLDNYECNMYANKSFMFFDTTYPSKKKKTAQKS